MQSINYDELVDIGYIIKTTSETMYNDIQSNIDKVKTTLSNKAFISELATEKAISELTQLRKAARNLYNISLKYGQFISETVPESYRQAEMEAGGKLAVMVTDACPPDEYYDNQDQYFGNN